MNRSQLKAATNAFLDELISTRFSHKASADIDIYDILIDGKRIEDGGNQRNIDKRVARLKKIIGKVYRKHIEQLLETAADGSTPVSQKEGV